MYACHENKIFYSILFYSSHQTVPPWAQADCSLIKLYAIVTRVLTVRQINISRAISHCCARSVNNHVQLQYLYTV